MHNRKISLWFVLPLFSVSLYGADLPSIQEKTKGMKRFEGFMDSYWNDATGEMFMKIDKFDSELLYIRSLSAGIGSNDIGLDRAQLGGSHLVLFERVGPCGVPWKNEDVGTEQLSMDTSVKGHRHDQTVISFIVKELMKEKPLMFQIGELGPHFYSQEYINQEYKKDPSKDAYYFPAEASFTHHPTKYHHEGTLIR